MAAVGDRTRLEGAYATVLYIGPVDQQEGVWVGLQWDTPARGKHDGVVGGRRYFQGAAGACSFVRSAKFRQLAAQPASIVEALKARYTVDSSEAMSILTASNRSLDVRLVGRQEVASRQSELQRLTTASLAECLCSHVVGQPWAVDPSCFLPAIVVWDAGRPAWHCLAGHQWSPRMPCAEPPGARPL